MTSMLTLLLILLGGAYWHWGGEVLGRMVLGEGMGTGRSWKQELVPLAVTSLTYELSTNRWTLFDLPPKVAHLRMVSNANAHRSALLSAANPTDATLEKIWSYALEWEALDHAGQVLRHSVHHLRTGLSLFKVGAEVHPGAFYLDHDLEPLDGAVTQLDVGDLAGLHQLRIRLATRDADLTDVVVRLYTPEEESEHRLGVVWQRMNDRQKELLSRGNLFFHDLLTEEEKRNLLRRPWKPLAPAGWEGTDYRTRPIYSVQDDVIQRTEPPALPAGVISGPGQIGVIPLPEAGGRVRLTWAPLPEVQTSDLSKHNPAPGITLRWIGLNPSQRGSQVIPWDPGVWHGKLQGGMLEIESNHPASFRAFLDAETGLEITPQPAKVRGYRLLAERPVQYAINHVNTQPTPFRLDVRMVAEATRLDESLQPPAVVYHLLDKDGQVVEKGCQIPVLSWSLYDRLPDQRRVSDPLVLHFLLPSNVVSFKVFSSGVSSVELLVAGSTRPAEWPWVRRMPEERFDYDNKEINHHRAWFPVRPEGFDQMIQRQETLLVTLQSRPPEVDLDLAAGRYLWTELRPEGAWLGRRLLTPRTADQPIRFETLPILFQPLVPKKSIRLRFDDGVASSMLVWKRRVATPFPLSLSVDGTPFFAATLAGTTGFVELPTIGKGVHRITLQAPESGYYYINGAAPSALATDKGLTVHGAGATPSALATDKGLTVHGAGAAPSALATDKGLTVHGAASSTLATDKELTVNGAAGSTLAADKELTVHGADPFALATDKELHLLRLANRIGENGLSFTLQRTVTIPETLWGRFYRLGEASRSQLSVRIEGLPKSRTEPFQQWSFDHLRLDLRSDNPGTTLVLGSAGERVDGGQPFFIHFGDGTPPGRYRIHVQAEAGVSGYVILAQVIPGVVEQRRMFMEERRLTHSN
ncbi:MAG: hypothetical protein H7839_05710 [Magnetococcus sp. YQC-5]